MPAFLNRVFKRDANSKRTNGPVVSEQPSKPTWTDGWARTEVDPEEVQELIRGCTTEVKSRGLSTPFLLLPYRPNTDPCAARSFIRNYFNPTNAPPTGTHLQQELRLTDPDVLCSALKWCWSRLPGGVVTWEVYEMFRQGEVDSSMARDSFATFIPISAESEARSKIIFDYFDLLSAIAANGKHNGLGGLKLSRFAGWWAFEHSDTGYGFEGGYSSWTSAADATCHLFFAYLRSLSPADPSRSVSLLPTSLRALLASIDYPPVTPPQFQTRTVRVVVTVDKVSPSPFALLRRAKNLQYNHSDLALKVFTDFDDPVKALTDECRRVLKCISSTGQSSNKASTGLQDQSWSRFQDMGFTALTPESDESDDELPLEAFSRRRISTQSHPNPTLVPTTPRDRDDYADLARPTTPSWADFMDGGFGDREMAQTTPAPHLLPPDKTLPPIETTDRLKSSQSNRKMLTLEPGELERITPMEVDDVFWWVWMSSLAGEETANRKSVFGRCALVETTVQGAKWLVVEEKIRGAAVMTETPAVTKKDKKWTKRTRLRRKSVGVAEVPSQQTTKQFNAAVHTSSRTNIGPDQTAKIQAAAAALRQQQTASEFPQLRRGKPRENVPDTKTNSVFTLQPVIMSEATPAMKWANRYDRDNLRDTYLKGAPPPEKKPVDTERSLPALPKEESVLPVRSLLDLPPTTTAPVKNNPPPSPVTTLSPTPQTLSGRSSPASIGKRATTSPSHTPSTAPAPERVGKKVSRLRAMFGMKAEGALPMGNQLAVPTNSVVRKTSLRRKQTPASPVTAEPTATTPVEKEIAPAQVPPPVEEHPAISGKSPFSSFNQGPLEDQPAFVPEDSPEVSDMDSPAPPANDDTSEMSAPNTAEPIQDRWAQIRKNAAERAKSQAKTDEVSAATLDMRRSMDEGETSGEESIESRVARIKARVALLNAEGNTNNRA